MTKEPIMIDDKYWEKKYADMHIRLTNENSELKEQLKRKEQERKELLTKIKIQKEENIKFTLATRKLVSQYSSKLEKLRQALKKTKAKLKEFKDMAKQGLDNYKDVGGCWGCGISFSFDELLESYKKLETKNKKYKQALQEIKELAKETSKIYPTKTLSQILQKCEDVL